MHIVAYRVHCVPIISYCTSEQTSWLSQCRVITPSSFWALSHIWFHHLCVSRRPFALRAIFQRPVRVFTFATMIAAIQLILGLFLFNSATALLPIREYFASGNQTQRNYLHRLILFYYFSESAYYILLTHRYFRRYFGLPSRFHLVPFYCDNGLPTIYERSHYRLELYVHCTPQQLQLWTMFFRYLISFLPISNINFTKYVHHRQLAYYCMFCFNNITT